MNPDVAGSHMSADVEALCAEDGALLAHFSLVIASQLPVAAAAKIAATCERRALPLIVRPRVDSLKPHGSTDPVSPLQLARSYGFIGSVRLCVGQHPVTESKPDAAVPDMRLSDPFPALQRLADGVDLGSMDAHARSHTPYVLLLIKHAQEWAAEARAPQQAAGNLVRLTHHTPRSTAASCPPRSWRSRTSRRACSGTLSGPSPSPASGTT